jgi:ubiquinone/menaquinone biosynthesis C-methylase UbiE
MARMSNAEFDAGYFDRELSDHTKEWHATVREEHDMIERLMLPKPPERILDIGSGKGRIEDLMLRLESDIDMTSSDVTPESKKYVRGKFVECSMTKLPFPDESFDKIFCQHVLPTLKADSMVLMKHFVYSKKAAN